MFKFICFSVLVLSIVGQHTAHGYLHKSADGKQFSGKNCQKEYSETCLKLDIASFIDKMSERREFKILPQLSVVREENNNNEAESARMMSDIVRSFPDDKDKRLDSYIFAKLSNFLQSHTLKIQLMDQESVAEARAAFTGRKKGGLGGKKGGMEAILAAGMMMKGTLMAMAMGGVALLAGKALMTGMIALVLAAISALKSMSSGGKQTTYEIVAKPVYSSSHTHSSSHEDVHGHGGGGGGGGGHGSYGGYGRAFDSVSPFSKPQ